MCVNCGNSQRGDTIYKCSSCGFIGCSVCTDGILWAYCPRCANKYYDENGEPIKQGMSSIGKIEE